MLKRFLLTLVVASVCSAPGFAQVVVYDNNQGNAVDNAVVSDVGAFLAGSNVDDVTLAATTAVTGINWSGSYSASPIPGGDGVVAAADENFTINIWADAGATPDIAAGTVASFNVANANNRSTRADGVTFDYAADINFQFDGGVSYWLAIVNNTTGDTDGFNQGVSTAAGNAFGTFDPVGFGGLIQQTYATDFQLTAAPTNTIPEPTSAALLALGFAGLFTRRRR